MSSPTYDVVAIGNAVVDILAHADDAFIAAEGMTKGSMQLVFSPEAADSLYAKMGPGIEASGGSAANTIAGIAALGGKCGFIGQVADDQLGAVFVHDMQSLGVHFDTAKRPGDPATGRVLIFVTPDGQRTMNTYLGASQYLPEAEIDHDLITAGAILYLEGYLWDPEEPRAAMRAAITSAKAAGRKVAFSPSAEFVIDRYRADFLDLIDQGLIDILFANDAELLALAEASDVDAALTRLTPKIPTVVVTMGADGARAVQDGKRVSVPAEPIERVVDTTGAGDLFAAGFLRGQAQGWDLEKSLKLGAVCAAEIISHVGARPMCDMQALAAEKLG